MVKRKRSRSAEKLEIKNHIFVPLHEKCSESEKKQLLTHYHAEIKDLPKINYLDPALYNLDVKPGDIIRIMRESATAGKTVFYRVVIEI